MAASSTRKTVLILDFDLYKSIGGGQTVYCRLIEENPTWQFFYFIDKELPDAIRPGNTTAIPYDECYSANAYQMPTRLKFVHDEFEHAWRLAGSVRRALGPVRFDVVDAPDYTRRGVFIRHTLELHGIEVGHVAVALHGTISQPLSWPWPSAGKTPRRKLAELRLLEHLQFRTADLRYAISDAYQAAWTSKTNAQVTLIDPLSVTGPLQPVPASGTGKPDLIFVGRRERRKGPDLFLDLVWCLDPDLYGRIIFIGAADAESDEHIRRTARLRGLEVELRPAIPRKELDEIFRQRVVLIVPSKVDTFNLVALEALRLGCPTFISMETGISTWLAGHYPSLRDYLIPIDCGRGAVPVLEAALTDYDATRRRLVEELQKPAAQTNERGLSDVYEVAPDAQIDQTARTLRNELQWHMSMFFRPVDPPAMNAVRPLYLYPDADALSLPTFSVYATEKSEPLLRDFATQYERLDDLRGRLTAAPEQTTRDIEAKLRTLDEYVGDVRVGRISLFAEMARLERRRGNHFVAAAYHLRIMRWAGYDRLGAVDYVCDTLRKNNQAASADAAHAMYADPKLAFDRSLKLLKEQYELQRTKPDLPLAIFDDRRKHPDPKVAIVVSLYNAASKLPTLLTNIALQTLARAGKLEVVLVDSNSPTDEYRVFQDWMTRSDLDIVYCRSEKRETIQAAWNRGIKIARAHYLCFLGADEGLNPRCLERLAGILDADPALDWITADSIVTDVDRAGRFDRDIMAYMRKGLDKNMQQLECCYVNYVGGLYRKTIHDRFGYYDEGFRGAGDTEFKARLLPHISVAGLPEALGVFNNYPEARTTASPMAEIEDLRAWYLHRTPAGLAYRFEKEGPDAVWNLIRQSIQYRKSYCEHLSTDFDLAGAAMDYLRRIAPKHPGLAAAGLVRDLRQALRELDGVDFSTTGGWRRSFIASMMNWFPAQQEAAQRAFDLADEPIFRFVNDNRFEQHWWSWSGL